MQPDKTLTRLVNRCLSLVIRDLQLRAFLDENLQGN